MKIQIIHDRTDDPGCFIEVYLDGRKLSVADVEIEDIDPGRGYDWRDSWQPRLDDAMSARDRNPDSEYHADVVQALLGASDNEHIKNRPPNWGRPYGYEPL